MNNNQYINQKKMIEWGLDAPCALVLSCLYFIADGRQSEFIEDYSNLCHFFPALITTTDSAKLILETLQARSLIVVEFWDDEYVFSLTDKAKEWV